MSGRIPGRVPAGQGDDRASRFHRELAGFPAALFQIDRRMRDGWLSDKYFVRAARTLAHAGRDPVVLLQFFPKRTGIVAGILECVRTLQTQVLPACDVRELDVDALCEGDSIEPWEVALRVRGRYRAFAHLETPLDGILSRRSLIASNASRAVQAAGKTPVIFFAPRHDDWRVQTPDGYAAHVGGTSDVSSDAGAAWWGGEGVGTMPHALIAAFGGDTVAATLAFARYARSEEPEVSIVSLVDYRNDSVRESLAVARAMRSEFGPGVLHGVRLDTAGELVDRSLADDEPAGRGESRRGVCPELVRVVRAALDREGFDGVRIMVSGGFTPRKIRRFAELGLPIDAYGVGSSILGHGRETEGVLTDFDFTADVVEVEGRPEAKVGRGIRENPRLVRIDWALLERVDTEVNRA